ncbi:hypothetical protein CCYA_CCYA03G0976 [Cyanidiococcus yangmingshanensis]|nr:hypothetical protein CCYA_CCYA03G0976 [Cyanidiococcus yangmingshanensis]
MGVQLGLEEGRLRAGSSRQSKRSRASSSQDDEEPSESSSWSENGGNSVLADLEVVRRQPLRKARASRSLRVRSSSSEESDEGLLSSEAEEELMQPSKRRRETRDSRVACPGPAEDGEAEDEQSLQPYSGSSSELESFSMERILARRVRHMTMEEAAEAGMSPSSGVRAYSGAGERSPIEGQMERTRTRTPMVEEYLIKFKGLSYIHCQWVHEDYILAQPNGKQRLQRFLSKEQQEAAYRGVLGSTADAEDHDEEDEAIPEDFVTVDRIIAEHVSADGTRQFLVKWCSLGYDECTWEYEQEVQDDLKIQEFYERNKVPTESERKRLPRPSPSAYATLPNPSFKGGGELRDYQLEGLNWLVHCWFKRQGSILADEMGLGKTIQAVSFLDYLYREQNIRGPFLVVAPLSTLGHWKREFETWTHMNAIVFHGNVRAREVIFQYEWTYPGMTAKLGMFKWHVLITTYETVLQEATRLRAIPWAAIVVDEAHRLKNRQSKLFDELLGFRSEHRVLLTGTPLQNNSLELFSLLHFLEPTKFPDEKAFQKSFGDIRDAEAVEKLKALLRPYLLRRMKEDVEKAIPPKEETLISVELTRIQKKWYRALYEQNFAFLEQGGKRNNVGNLRNIVMELRKCCNHPYLIRGVEEIETHETVQQGEEGLMRHLVEASGKLVLVDKLLPVLREKGHRVLIFSQMIRVLDILEDYLHWRGYKFERLDGRVRGNDRQQSIDRFQRDPENFVFLLCTRAGGQGINLTVADTVIIFDSDWNPQNDIQAQARCHRIGQERDVKVYRLITRGTYEEEMFDRASKKLGLDQAVLQNMGVDQGGNILSALGKDDINRLLRRGAYDVFNEDDSAADAFTTENIENIMARRTKTIKTGGAGDLGPSAFSKATFTAESDSNFGDETWLNDKEFWKKLMPQAASAPNPDIIYEPRRRRQVQRFQPGENSDDENGDHDSDSDEVDLTEDKLGPDGRKLWNKSERHRFHRALLTYGYGEWPRIAQTVSRALRSGDQRSEFEVQRAARSWLRLLAEHTAAALVAGDEVDVLQQEQLVQERLERLREEKRVLRAAYEPWLDQDTQKPIDESFTEPVFQEDSYLDAMERNGYNWIERLECIEDIKELVRNGDIEGEIPMVSASGIYVMPEWWDAEFDRALILGTYRHGYGQYEDMRRDPELYFFGRVAPLPMPEQFEGSSPEERDAKVAEWMALDQRYRDRASALGLNEETLLGREMPTLHILNTRLKKLLKAFQRIRRRQDRRRSQREQAEERARAREEQQQARRRQREAVERERLARFEIQAQRWSKREKHDFGRLLGRLGGVIYGADGRIDWSAYKERCQLSRKFDYNLERMYIETLAMGRECFRRTGDDALAQALDEPIEYALQWRASQHEMRLAELHRAAREGTQSATRVAALEECLRSPQLEGFPPTELEEMRALFILSRRFVERVRVLHFIRVMAAPLLQNPELCAQLVEKVPPPRPDMLPSWWSVSDGHDIALLRGVIRYGFDTAPLALDRSLPFYEICSQLAQTSNTGEQPDESERKSDGDVESRSTSRDDDLVAHFAKHRGVFLRARIVAEMLVYGRTEGNYLAESGVEKNEMAVDLSHSHQKPNSLGSLRVYATASGEPIRSDTDEGFEPISEDALTRDMLHAFKQLKKRAQDSSLVSLPEQVLSLGRLLQRQMIREETMLDSAASPSMLPTPPWSEQNAHAEPADLSSASVKRKGGASPEESGSRLPSETVSRPVQAHREQTAQNMPVVRKSQLHKVVRDEQGQVRLPIQIGVVLRIESLGHIDLRDGFHTERAIYPVGFRSVRTYTSCQDVNRTTQYTSEVLDRDGHPWFRVTCADLPEQSFEDKSPTGCWSQIMRLIRDRTPLDKRRVHATVSGPEYFGLTQPIVEELLQSMPEAAKLKHYQFKQFVSPDKAESEERRPHPASEEDENRSRSPDLKENETLVADPVRIRLWVQPSE